MKKIALVVTAVAMCVCLAACGSSKPAEQPQGGEPEAGIPNPVTEVTEDEMVQATGVDLPAPEGATDVAYATIQGEDGVVLAQMTYTLNGHVFTERACYTSMTSLGGDAASDPDANIEDVVAAFDNGNISGLYYEWERGAVQEVANREAVAQFSKEGPCYIAWLDVVPGVLYNLSCNDALTDAELVQAAETVFIPMQGEV